MRETVERWHTRLGTSSVVASKLQVMWHSDKWTDRYRHSWHSTPHYLLLTHSPIGHWKPVRVCQMSSRDLHSLRSESDSTLISSELLRNAIKCLFVCHDCQLSQRLATTGLYSRLTLRNVWSFDIKILFSLSYWEGFRFNRCAVNLSNSDFCHVWAQGLGLRSGAGGAHTTHCSRQSLPPPTGFGSIDTECQTIMPKL